MTKPLPCPFCGDDCGLTMTDGSTYRWGYAYCSNCGASAGETRRSYPDDGKWHDDAIKQWNQRGAGVRREWRGLTNQEINDIYEEHGEDTGYGYERAIEAALKEKNA